jgi:hypothetical protein
MAESAVTVAIKPDLGWNDEQGRRLALRADHGHTSGKKHDKRLARTTITGKNQL